MPILPAVIGAVASLGGGVINALNANSNIKRQNEANANLASMEYNRNVEMWNKGNVYNSPVEQMKRLKEAGLNPNLVYGNGSVVGNTTSQLPKYSAPTANASNVIPDLTRMLGTFQDFLINQGRTENLKAQKELIEANSARTRNLTDWETGPGGLLSAKNVIDLNRGELLKSQSSYYRGTRDLAYRKLEQENESIIQGIKSIIQRTNLMKSQNLGVDITNKFMSGSQLSQIVSRLVPLLMYR